jgi:hypothetical protein
LDSLDSLDNLDNLEKFGKIWIILDNFLIIFWIILDNFWIILDIFSELNGNLPKFTGPESVRQDPLAKPPRPTSMTSSASATLASVQAALTALQAGQMSLNQVGTGMETLILIKCF